MKSIKLKDIIISESENYIFINKPAGISSLHDWSSETTILSLAKEYCEDPQLCHRIDKETSGILAIAKTPEAYRHMSMQFERRTVDKIYHAVVEGVQDIDPLQIDRPIHAMSKGKVRIDFDQGKPASTLIKPAEVFQRHTLMHCKPITGRMHQIRIHLSSLHMPIVADTMYGAEEIYLSDIKKKKFHLKQGTEEQPLIKRFALHAFSLTCNELDGTTHTYEAPYPKDFNVLIKQLRKNS
ncbi:pseudouridine synthase [Cyclobacteriaceae bacterium]|nr:pseudouridine synthase [Cyclobacteriaceae bacterium]